MEGNEKIPFQEVIHSLLDVDTPLPPRFLYRLSDLDPGELKSLERVWPDIPTWRRRALLEDAQEIGERDTVLSFEALARFAAGDPEASVRLPALRALWEYEEPDLIQVFLSHLETDPDPDVRVAAAAGLGRFVYVGELEELPARIARNLEDRLLHVVNDPDASPRLRREALGSLGFSSREELPPLIEAAYNSGDKDWLATALLAMGRSANERWNPLVVAMLESQHPAVRAEAARAVGELEIRHALPRLFELLDDPDERTRRAGIWSLSQLGGTGVRERLERLLKEAEEENEVDFLETALDNLSFTEDMRLLPIFDFSTHDEDEEEEFEFDLDDFADDDDDLFEDDEDLTD